MAKPVYFIDQFSASGGDHQLVLLGPSIFVNEDLDGEKM
jgi:hypothetical protein